MKSKLVTSGLLLGLVAGSGAGLVLQSGGFAGAAAPAVVAQTDDTTTDSTTGSTDSTTGSTESTDTRPDRSARLTEVLQPLVDDGTLTAAQLDAVIAALDAAGPGIGGRDGRGGPGGGGMGRGLGLDTAAEALGLTVDELRTALEGGQTLAEVAAAEGIDVQTLVDALVLEAGTHLSEHVAAGDLTQEEADARLAEMTTRITDMVNNGMPMGGRGEMGGEMGGMGRHGRGGDDSTTDGSTTDGSTTDGSTTDGSTTTDDASA